MFRRYKTAMVVSMLIALALAGCTVSSRQTKLTVHLGHPVHYISPDGVRIVATYGSLSDDSLDFVKVRMPNGQEYTLPRVLSASGVRYTDEHELVWWTKGETASVQVRDAEGDWETKYPELREVPEKN